MSKHTASAPAAPTPPDRRWREVSRQLRAAVWRLQAPGELSDLLHEILRGVLDLGMPVSGCSVNLVDADVDPPAVTVHSLRTGEGPRVVRTTAGPVLDFWRDGKPVLRDLDGDDPCDERRAFPGLSTIVDVPFSHGTLAANSRQRHAFGGQDVARLQDIADLLGDGFRRLAELCRLQVRQRVREQVWRMRSPADIVSVMTALRQGLKELGVPFTACGLNLVLDAEDTLVHTMEPDVAWTRLTQRGEDPVVSAIWRSGRTAYRRDLDAEDVYGEAPRLRQGYGEPIRCVVDVPFSHGTLALNHTRPSAFSDQQIAIVEDLAGTLEGGFRRLDDLQALEARNRALEREVAERTRAEADLAASVAEKEVLLKEIHHRVKNNLQIVSSLLSLRARTLQDPEAQRSFEDCRAQIRSMALIHERLYEAPDLTRIDCSGYLGALARNVLASYGVASERLRLEVDTTPHNVTVDTAIQCGLVLHELVSNALRHAFPDGRGTVRVAAAPTGDGRGCLRVADDGIGLPAGLEPGRARTLGLSLVADLARQLNGPVDVQRDGGTAISLTYPVEE